MCVGYPMVYITFLLAIMNYANYYYHPPYVIVSSQNVHKVCTYMYMVYLSNGLSVVVLPNIQSIISDIYIHTMVIYKLYIIYVYIQKDQNGSC